MKGLVYIGDKKIELKEIENPKIIDSKDAIVKVQLSSICTSDFHIINGQVPRANKNIVLGHEFVGQLHNFLRRMLLLQEWVYKQLRERWLGDRLPH